MEHTLDVATREKVGKQAKALRRAGVIPAVCYGKGIQSALLQVPTQDFTKLYNQAGTSSIVTLKLDGKQSIKVLIRQPQLDPVSLRPVHVDFYQVNMKDKIRTEIPLQFTGEAPVVVDLDGKLVHSLDAIEVECLPDDLVPHIDVDISKLVEFDQAIHVKDLNIPAEIEVLTDPELTVVVAQAPLTEEQLEAELAEETTEEEAIAAVEVEEKGETEEGEETIAETIDTQQK